MSLLFLVHIHTLVHSKTHSQNRAWRRHCHWGQGEIFSDAGPTLSGSRTLWKKGTFHSGDELHKSCCRNAKTFHPWGKFLLSKKPLEPLSPKYHKDHLDCYFFLLGAWKSQIMPCKLICSFIRNHLNFFSCSNTYSYNNDNLHQFLPVSETFLHVSYAVS